MNLPNLLTLSRIPLMLIVIALLYPTSETSLPWIRTGALVVFLFAALTDWLDGWLARKFGQVSEFGKFMDALSDKVLTLGMFISLLALDEIALWALFPILLILSREFLITGLRLVAAGRGKTLAAEKIGKLKTVIQLTCICLFLGKIAVEDDFTGIFAPEFQENLIQILLLSGRITLIAATLITVISGIIYLSKYWRFFIEEDQ
ncbi:MAG: CDP-diacylglycerol--glycerol-3-phosphate 3-phosphatidyltransferase [Opitutales bacterium]|nr:CDP-diacylglycerol--glycerol-3-phosphate 3-phosphatidyltransferase [Opitutales bacterium]MDG1325606.1 CDP-diacylglycerol--glycerol-3-phosphate 3-phosphatidyltransferase [Opitutales bacterium]